MLPVSGDQVKAVQSWLVEAGKIAMQGYATASMHLKDDHTPVTDVEYRIEAYLIDKIRQNFPGHQIVSEESGVTAEESEFLWAMDPIDGTKPYLRRLPSWGISLALLVRAEPRLGFFYMPATQEMYSALDDGAYWQGRRLNVQEEKPYEDGLMFLAVPSNAHRHYRLDYPRLQAFGSTAAHMAFVARGIAAGALTRRVYIWDIAGVLPILKKAGMACEYLSGKPVELRPLLGGQRTPEPLLAARPEWMDRLRAGIHLQEG